MTVLVFLRSSFGYAFLRPKSVFFAFSWAFGLFVIVAWNEPELWREYRAVCVFGLGSATLYWLHLLITFRRDIERRGQHDHFSGRSHLLPLTRLFEIPPEKAELHLHLWIEPLAVAVLALVLRFVTSERHLSQWLIIAAAALAGSEFINFWAGMIRREKVAKDIADDAENQSGQLSDKVDSSTPKATRKEPVRLRRNTGAKDDLAEREKRFAELLRLLPPYQLAQAEQNYLTLIQQAHSDTGQSQPRDIDSAQLDEAIAYFRNRLRG